MAGTINLSLTQQLDEYGEPLSGGQLYLIQAGTVSTPQNAFQDSALTIPWPNPITLDAAGRIPQFFLADGQIKVRLQDVKGVVKFVADNLLVIGPSGGGGGGGQVDPTSVLQTGDIKIRYDNALINGFVRVNGRTIGSASSGATELADPSAQALFLHLWQKDTTLTVSGGRGASAAADWAANKTLTLPDGRNRLLMALADMGNSDVGLLASNIFTKGNQITLGSTLGAGRRAVTNNELPTHNHYAPIADPGHAHGASAATSVAISDPGHAHNFSYTIPSLGPGTGSTPNYFYSGAAGGRGTTDGAVTGISASASTSVSIAGAGVGVYVNGAAPYYTANNGNGAPFDMANPMLLITVYMKL